MPIRPRRIIESALEFTHDTSTTRRMLFKINRKLLVVKHEQGIKDYRYPTESNDVILIDGWGNKCPAPIDNLILPHLLANKPRALSLQLHLLKWR